MKDKKANKNNKKNEKIKGSSVINENIIGDEKEIKQDNKDKKDSKKSGSDGKKREPRKRGKLSWDKLDNTATLFPVIATQEMSNVYRIAVNLNEEVDEEILEEAVHRVVEQIPLFGMRLREGVFWYYFEENNKPLPRVMEETQVPGAYINKTRNNQYMFRVTYYKCRINLEVFHALTDGFGGSIFLKEIVYQYLRLKHPEDLKDEKDKISSGIFLDSEDSYVKNFKKNKKYKKYKSSKAVTLEGEKFVNGKLGVMHGFMKFSEVRAASKKRGLTINQYIVGMFVYAVYKEYLNSSASKYPISCCVPVNLRPYYDSHTLKNFFAMVSADFQPDDREYTCDEVLNIVKENLEEKITKKNLDDILSYNVSNEKNMLLRIIPITVKKFALRRVYGASTHATTATITNIGNFKLKEPYEKYVENFYCILSMSKGQNMKGAVLSYNGILNINFSSCLTDTSIQKRFFKLIEQDGVEIAVETNGVYYE